MEDLNHLIFFCDHSRHVRHATQFGYITGENQNLSFRDWWREINKLLKETNNSILLNLTAIICWNIWRVRNGLQFKDSKEDPLVTMEYIREKWQQLQSSRDHQEIIRQQ